MLFYTGMSNMGCFEGVYKIISSHVSRKWHGKAKTRSSAMKKNLKKRSGIKVDDKKRAIFNIDEVKAGANRSNISSNIMIFWCLMKCLNGLCMGKFSHFSKKEEKIVFDDVWWNMFQNIFSSNIFLHQNGEIWCLIGLVEFFIKEFDFQAFLFFFRTSNVEIFYVFAIKVI